MAVCTRSIDPQAFKGIFEGQPVHDGADHADVMRGRLVHAAFDPGCATPQVAPADDNGDLYAQVMNLLDFDGNFFGTVGVNAQPFRACHGFRRRV